MERMKIVQKEEPPKSHFRTTDITGLESKRGVSYSFLFSFILLAFDLKYLLEFYI